MPGYGAYGHRVTLSSTDALIQAADVPTLPSRMSPVPDNNIGCLDERPLQVLIGFSPHPAITDLALPPLAFTLGTVPQ